MGYFSRAISITKSDTINSLPAWEFMNQTGTLGTFLAGSLVYVGGAGDVNVIVAGTLGPQNTVVDFQAITAGGTGYTGANGVATTGGSGTGLTVNTTDTNNVITAAVVNAAGTFSCPKLVGKEVSMFELTGAAVSTTEEGSK